MTRRTIGKACLSFLLLSALILGVFGRLVVQPSALLVDGERPSIDKAVKPADRSVGNDLTRLFLPHHMRIAAHVARTGRVPLWDPAGFGGRPLLGNPQAGIWYPPAWLAWCWGSPAALGWITVGHLLLAAFGTWVLARSLGISPFASCVAGLGFALSPYMLAQVAEGHMPHVWGASWYPWAFLTFLTWRRAGSPLAVLALAPVLAVSALSGHPQEAYLLVIALSVWVATAEVYRRLPSRWIARSPGQLNRYSIPTWLGVLAISAGLCAMDLIPIIKAGAWTLPDQAFSMGQAGRYHVEPWNLLQLLSPTALGTASTFFGPDNAWETLLSFGWVPLILATVAFRRTDRAAEVRPWVLLTLASIVFACGVRLGLFALAYQLVPGMDRFRVPARMMFAASLGMAILAGYGIEVLRDTRGRLNWVSLHRHYSRVAMVVGTLVGGLGWLAWRIEVNSERIESELDRLLAAGRQIAMEPMFWVVLVGLGAAFARGERRPWIARRVAVAAGILAVLELAWYGAGTVKVAPAAPFLGIDRIAQELRDLQTGKPYRIRARDLFYPDLEAISAGLEKTNINDYFQIAHAAALYEALYPQFDPLWPKERGNPGLEWKNRAIRQAVLERMNVDFLVTDRPPTDPLPWIVAASGTHRGKPFWIYKNPTPLPRAYVVPHAEPCPDVLAVRAFPFVSPREAVLMPVDPLGPSVGLRQPFTPATYELPEADRVLVQVRTEAPGLLVVTDTWMPGWTAKVNGEPVEIARGDRAWRVIPIASAGTHRVEMTYQPPGLRMGLTIAITTGFLWLFLLVTAWRQSRRRLVMARDPALARTWRRFTPSRAASSATIPR